MLVRSAEKPQDSGGQCDIDHIINWLILSFPCQSPEVYRRHASFDCTQSNLQVLVNENSKAKKPNSKLITNTNVAMDYVHFFSVTTCGS